MLVDATVDETRARDWLAGGMRCDVCGCTDNAACPDGCTWVDVDLCSSCASAWPRGSA